MTRLRYQMHTKHGVIMQVHSTPRGILFTVRWGQDIMWQKFLPYGPRHLLRREALELEMANEAVNVVTQIEQAVFDAALT